MQIVFISIRPDVLTETMKYIENLVSFIQQALIVAPESLIPQFRFESRLRIRFISDEALLGKDRDLFRQADHQMRNWLLRMALAESPFVDDEFIMADDDNRPMVDIPLEFYKENGKYNSYYYHRLENWNRWESRYDLGQHNSLEALKQRNLPTLSFSSHIPQIINKSFLKTVGQEFSHIATMNSLDEWSIYFNFCQKSFPQSFNEPRVFKTLAWPALPSDWPFEVQPAGFFFENFYGDLYGKNMIFEGLPTAYDKQTHLTSTVEKVRRRMRIQGQYDQMKTLVDLSNDLSKRYSLFYDEIHFKEGDEHFIVKGLPRIVFAAMGNHIDLDIQIENMKKERGLTGLKRKETVKLSFHEINSRGICTHFGMKRYGLPEIMEQRNTSPMILRIPVTRKKPGISLVALDMVKGRNKWFVGEAFTYKVMVYLF